MKIIITVVVQKFKNVHQRNEEKVFIKYQSKINQIDDILSTFSFALQHLRVAAVCY